MADSTVDIGRSLGLSPQSRMVNGYGGKTRTLATMDDVWNWRVLHPEMKRRELALFFSDPRTTSAGTDARGLAILTTKLGNGSSGRATGAAAVANFWRRNSRTYLAGRPSRNTPEGRAWLKPGYAPIAYPGNSNHEADTYQGHGMATDTVGWNTHPWMNQNVDRYRLRDFRNIGSEPWHLQFAGYGASKSSLQRDLAARGHDAVSLPPIPLASKPAPLPPPTPPNELTLEDEDMKYLAEHRRIIDTRSEGGIVKAGTVRKIPLGMLNIAALNVTAIASGRGFLSIGGSPVASAGTSAANYDADGVTNASLVGAFPDGHAYVKANGSDCHVIVDMQAFGATS